MRGIRNGLSVLLSGGVLLAGCGSPRRVEAEKAAEAEATAWLAAMDAGRYAACREVAAASLQHAMPTETWLQTLKSRREPLGRVRSRTRTSRRYWTTLPGVPEGEYVVLQYETLFDPGGAARETLACVRTANGRWKIAGYTIEPARKPGSRPPAGGKESTP